MLQKHFNFSWCFFAFIAAAFYKEQQYLYKKYETCWWDKDKLTPSLWCRGTVTHLKHQRLLVQIQARTVFAVKLLEHFLVDSWEETEPPLKAKDGGEVETAQAFQVQGCWFKTESLRRDSEKNGIPTCAWCWWKMVERLNSIQMRFPNWSKQLKKERVPRTKPKEVSCVQNMTIQEESGSNILTSNWEQTRLRKKGNEVWLSTVLTKEGFNFFFFFFKA